MSRSEFQSLNDNFSNSFEEIKDVAIYIIDLSKGEFQYMGIPILELTGYLPFYFTKNGLAGLFQILDDKDFNRVKEKYATSFWESRDTNLTQPEILSDIFRIKRKDDDGISWIENTIVILNYTDELAPKKALGYLKSVNPNELVNYEDRVNSLRQIILGSNPPIGIAKITSLKNWQQEHTDTFHKDSLLQVAFQGVLSFKLTKREREILKHIADGYSAKEIAAVLFICESTVVTHRKHLLDKFQVKNIAELIKVASKHFHFN